ncbi:MAG: hypothetical protein SGJ09_15875, partial [Phycisphaerae bacterium]|nr:hypothetical protein [Phycisphaerae bacterium]
MVVPSWACRRGRAVVGVPSWAWWGKSRSGGRIKRPITRAFGLLTGLEGTTAGVAARAARPGFLAAGNAQAGVGREYYTRDLTGQPRRTPRAGSGSGS